MEKGHHPQGREGVNSLIFNPVNAEATATAERKQVVVGGGAERDYKPGEHSNKQLAWEKILEIKLKCS